MDAHVIAQLCMLATLILMITGKTPIYGTSSPGPFLRGSTTKNLFLS